MSSNSAIDEDKFTNYTSCANCHWDTYKIILNITLFPTYLRQEIDTSGTIVFTSVSKYQFLFQMYDHNFQKVKLNGFNSWVWWRVLFPRDKVKCIVIPSMLLNFIYVLQLTTSWNRHPCEILFLIVLFCFQVPSIKCPQY